MIPRFVTKTVHAYLDYPVAISLIALPFVLELGGSHPAALWLSVVTGVAAFILTILTDHHLGLIRVLSYRFHLVVDFAVGALFTLIPFVLGFHGIDAIYYWVNGLAVLTVVSLHKPEGNMQLA
ncbi:hypothetical protein O4H49_03960 [Kiloniella laminariae]|uniref:SPW repeat-containing integral membrane domain-containing protein n=1 Tax=Kiloniella laminariae TaxID=454162 RepID=A0ABT4LFP7_9PROT|nr:hypothetical protein [Kiloniella laminariae]MCZ4279919.1 hypothetical protein [Kiloniella laminariae]